LERGAVSVGWGRDRCALRNYAGISAKAMLADNDPWNFFDRIGDLW